MSALFANRRVTPPREGSLSPSSISPHGLGLARYMFPVALSRKELLLPLLCWSKGREVVGVPDVCAITDALLLCGAGLAGARSDGRAGAGPAGLAGLHHDLEIGKCTTTSSTSSISLTKLCYLQGYVLYECISTCCLYLIDRSWRIIVPIVGKILFSMLRIQ